MRIAVASRDGKKVSGHIGKCADWIIFELDSKLPSGEAPVVREMERIKLPRELVFHYFKDEGPHPLESCAAVIGASAGESFVNKMRQRGIEAVLTAEPDPVTAVTDYVRNTVTPARPRPIGSLICKVRDALSSSD